MGLTKRKDGWYVEFPVVDDGKVFQLARGIPCSKLKRWKTLTTNKTVAKQQEAMIKTDLMMGRMKRWKNHLRKKSRRRRPKAGCAESYGYIQRRSSSKIPGY